jgi:hypothetical protein
MDLHFPIEKAFLIWSLILLSELHKPITSARNMEKLPQLSKETVVLRIRKKIKLTAVIIEGQHCYQLYKKMYH